MYNCLAKNKSELFVFEIDPLHQIKLKRQQLKMFLLYILDLPF